MKILVAYDGSNEAKRALDWARKIGGDGPVTVLSVAPTLEGSPRIADAVDPTSDLSEHSRQVDEARSSLERAGMTVETILRAGNPAEEIITTASEGSYELVLVGIRGMSAAQRFIIGSVAERVVRHATVPVLVVR
jgi:nucleotide-binding universal stress UspA family protein